MEEMEVQETLEEICEALYQLNQKKMLYEFLLAHMNKENSTVFQADYVFLQLENIHHDIFFYDDLFRQKIEQ